MYEPRRHEEQQETELSVAVLSFSLEHVTTRDETERSCCDHSRVSQTLTGPANVASLAAPLLFLLLSFSVTQLT